MNTPGIVVEGKAPGATIKLDLQTEQVMLITQLIEQMGCGTVRQLILCQQAAELLKDIRRQAVAQQK